ncbi:hypothetical protein [Halocalculus aciditolerans]|uniref:Exonuclease RecJ n=1 Tax=Halocalculus aciditolerans TaxID=1383812 RepID=A0A830F381_9EURY|nr:hypothetical protein [Halocalculus aciditolerans]GGL58369.1 hypothetical protein GCM10009039_15780 [Halocalculus aciditolerans]
MAASSRRARSEVHGALSGASFVRVAARADGDCLAAAGVLAGACEASGLPFQVSVVETPVEAERRFDGVDDGVCVAVGFDAGDASVRSDEASSASASAFESASALGAEPDAALALAGAVAAGRPPEGAPLDAVDGDIDRRPGLCVPTADVADGLAHSLRLHGDVSGDEAQAGALLAELALPAELDDSARRRLASRVALDVTESPAGERAATAIEAALRPHVLPDGPFATLEGYADVLDAVAATAPGLGVAFVLGHGDTPAVLDAWRETARAVHGRLRREAPARYSGCVTFDAADAPLRQTARLVRDYRSREPTAIAVGDDGAAVATHADDVDAHGVLADVVDVDVVAGTPALAWTTEDVDAEAVRGAL